MNSVLQPGQEDDKKYLFQIGRITVYFTMLESTVSWLIWKLMECDHQIGAIITSPMKFHGLLELLKSLGKHKGGKTNKFIIDNYPELKKVGERRGQIIHSMWSDHIDEDGNSILLRVKLNNKQRPGQKIQIETMTIQDLKDLVDQIGYIHISLMEFISKFNKDSIK